MMSNFRQFKKLQQTLISNMVDTNEVFFITSVNKDALWELYLSAFPAGTNEIYKERREYDCQCCRQFLRSMGNVVSVKDNKLVSIWDIVDAPYPFDVVTKELASLVKASPIKNMFLAEFNKLGTDSNNFLNEEDLVITYEHFYCELPKKFVNSSSKSIESIQGTHKASKDVFERSMRELTLDSAETVLDLISQNSVYRLAEHKDAVETFVKNKEAYDAVPNEDKENWCWVNSYKSPISRIRNSAVGTILVNLSEGVDLNIAVFKFENVMDPNKFQRPREVTSKKMIEEAKLKVVELGYENSLAREHAVISDITVNDVLWVNRATKAKMTNDPFADLQSDIPENVKNLDKVEEVGIEDFVKNILPTATNIEVIMENKHESNLVSLVAPLNKEAPSMFKWGNNFSWDYNGGVADSMREKVIAAGGRVDGVFRFTHSWNNLERNESLMDLHVFLPSHEAHNDGYHDNYGNSERVGWNRRNHAKTKGTQDVDYTAQAPINYIPVENITFPDITLMPEGEYPCKIHNWDFRKSGGKGEAEIEIGGEIYQYVYPQTKNKEWITVAVVTLKAGKFTIEHKLPMNSSSKEVWGLKTQQFTKVSNIMNSPNYWQGSSMTGNKHYFFFMEDCKNEGTPRGFYNEFLSNELTEHRKTFESLGAKMKVEKSDNQLSGLGFSSTQSNEIIVRVEGKFTRIIKVKF